MLKINKNKLIRDNNSKINKIVKNLSKFTKSKNIIVKN